MSDKKSNTLFVILAYAFFWALLVIALLILVSGNEELFLKILPYVQVIGTWAPTAALLVLFKKLYPGWTISKFYKNAFKERLNFKLLLVVTLVLAAIRFGLVGIVAITKQVSFFSLLEFSFAGFLITLFSGAMGEESGWRGHFQQSMEKKYSVLKSCFIVGVIWAFWHALTWADHVMSGALYLIPLHIISVISAAFIYGICYKRCRNLFVPMWIHFIHNMTINGTQGAINEIPIFVCYTMLTVFVAAGYVIWYINISKKEAAREIKMPA